MKLYEIFGMRLQPLYDRLTTYPDIEELQANSILKNYTSRDMSILMNYGVGIEVEAENAMEFDSQYWLMATDNSLRNNGMEYKTRYGVRIGHLPSMLLDLQKKSKWWQFTERTSVHAHMDCRMLQPEEARQFFILYLLFERSLFRYAGPERMYNVFCVPYNDSNKCYNTPDFVEVIRASEKYTAINLHTLTTFGTIEFRNMKGSADPNFIFNWVMLLAHMKMFATHIEPDKFKELITSLKTTSRFNHLRDEIFRGFAPLVQVESKEVDNAVSTAKLFL
jgi:hypothetical protein